MYHNLKYSPLATITVIKANQIFHHKSYHIDKLDYFVHCTPILLVIPVNVVMLLYVQNRKQEDERSVARKV